MIFHSILQSLMESDQVTVRVQEHKCRVNGLGQSTTALFEDWFINCGTMVQKEGHLRFPCH